ncbi:hypothetical protein [Streptomyces coffeae]|uniref:hypothetical protein n=1 Tax=Streptomyces coffeae TaxID=621382 RepID=UPI0027DB0EC6|nr:hypothetical protein [Streptomyces coffeae]
MVGEPERVRRLTDQEGQKRQQILRGGLAGAEWYEDQEFTAYGVTDADTDTPAPLGTGLVRRPHPAPHSTDG